MNTEDLILEGELVDNKWFLSAINGDLNYLKKHALDNAGKTGESNCTALMYSADCNRVGCVDYLVMFEEELGKIDINGNTALIYATKKNNVECVKILAKLESNIFNKDGKRAINFAREFGFVECFDILSKFETLDENDEDNKSTTDDGKDDSNSERNLIKENKKLRKEFNIVKSANNEVERKIVGKKDISK